MTDSLDSQGRPPKPSRQPRHRALLLLVAAVALSAGAAALLINARTPGTPAQQATSIPPAATAIPDDGVVAFYFHTTYRCTSCRKIEANSKLALETGFAGDIASGRLQFHMINIEDEGNGHYVKDYGLYTKSLVLSERAAGREIRWKNLNRVWELLNDEAAFVAYVQAETRAFLADGP